MFSLLKYNSIQNSMSHELNRLVSDILKRNEGNTKVAIQQLFQLLGTQLQENHLIIQKAILFSMENLHEWGNIMKYIQKWRVNEFKQGFIARMKKRLNEQPNEGESNDSSDEIKRLVENYWKTRSPKKQENNYKESINYKQIMKNINSTHLSKKQIEINQPKTLVIPQQKEKQEQKQSNQQRLDSNHSISQPEKRQKMDPLASVTGRPTILKKKSTFENQLKVSTQTSHQNRKQESNQSRQANKSRKPKERMINILKRFTDQQLSSESWQHFGKSKESAGIIKDELFPIDKFSFGSNKKSNENQMVKLPLLSPRKYDPTSKTVKLVRHQAVEDVKQPFNLHQFSFANSQKKVQPQDKVEQVIAFKTSQEQSTFKIHHSNSDQFVFQDNINSERDEGFIKNQFNSDSFLKAKSSVETPIFVFNDQKKRRSSVSKHHQVLTQLNLYDPNIKLRYFIKQMEVRAGIDVATMFQRQFANLLKNPQAYRQ